MIINSQFIKRSAWPTGKRKINRGITKMFFYNYILILVAFTALEQERIPLNKITFRNKRTHIKYGDSIPNLCSCATKCSVYRHSLMSPDWPWLWSQQISTVSTCSEMKCYIFGAHNTRHNIMLLHHGSTVALDSRPLLQGLVITMHNIFPLLLQKK